MKDRWPGGGMVLGMGDLGGEGEAPSFSYWLLCKLRPLLLLFCSALRDLALPIFK